MTIIKVNKFPFRDFCQHNGHTPAFTGARNCDQAKLNEQTCKRIAASVRVSRLCETQLHIRNSH